MSIEIESFSIEQLALISMPRFHRVGKDADATGGRQATESTIGARKTAGRRQPLANGIFVAVMTGVDE